MYYLKSDKADYGVLLPTNIEEITPEVLKELTKEIKLSKHYALICLAYKTSLFNLASEIGGAKRPDMINIIPLVAKVNTDDIISPVEGEHIIGSAPFIAPSSLERGHQVHVPSMASVNKVYSYISNDNDLRIKLFQKKYDGNIKYLGVNDITKEILIEDNNTPIIIIDFKIVPISDIVASSPIKPIINDPFLVRENKLIGD